MTLDLTVRDNITDDATLNLQYATSVATAVVGGIGYLFVAGYDDNGVSVFAIGADGSLANVDNVTDDDALNLSGAQSVATAVVGGTTYLFVAGYGDSGVSVFAVGNGGALTNVDNVADNATLELDGVSSVTTAVVGGTTYLFVAGINDGGISVFAVGADGSLANVDNVADNATLELDGASSVTTAVVGGTTYLFAAGYVDNGVSVFAVGDDGALTNVANVADDATLSLDGATSVTTATVGGTTYLFVAAYDDGSISVFAVGTDGSLTNVDNVSDDATLALAGAISVTTAEIGGVTYLIAAGFLDSGLNLFEVGADGSLTHVFSVLEDQNPGLELRQASSVTAAELGGSSYLFAAASYDDGLSVFELSSDDTLIGTDAPDTLNGLGGTDQIAGLAGDDLLAGGRGGDVLTGDGGNDFLIGGAEDDELFGGDGDADRAGYSGARSDYEVTQIDSTTVRIRDLRAGSPDGTDLVTDVELFHFAAANQTLSFQQLFQTAQLDATDAADALLFTGGQTAHALGGDDYIGGSGNLSIAFGDDGNDQLYLNGNQNQLFGSNGDDWLGVNGTNNALVGGAGNDWIGGSGTSNTLAGGDGNDSVFANGTNNYLHGESGNDWLGVSGSDNFLFGGAGDDWLGVSGNGNVLDGGAGNDTLVSAAGNLDTTFVFHAGYGQDIVQGFSAANGHVINLETFGLADFAALQPFLTQVGTDVTITLNGSDILTLQNVQLASLNAGHFDLV